MLKEENVDEIYANKLFCENLPEAVFVISQMGKILLVSKIAEKLSGYSREELVGHNLFKFNFIDKKIYLKLRRIYRKGYPVKTLIHTALK